MEKLFEVGKRTKQIKKVDNKSGQLSFLIGTYSNGINVSSFDVDSELEMFVNIINNLLQLFLVYIFDEISRRFDLQI